MAQQLPAQEPSINDGTYRIMTRSLFGTQYHAADESRLVQQGRAEMPRLQVGDCLFGAVSNPGTLQDTHLFFPLCFGGHFPT